MLELMVELYDELPQPGQVEYKFMGRLISFRTGVRLDQEVQTFDLAEYVKSLTATSVDVKKLQKGDYEFLRDVPKLATLPQWILSLKEAFKEWKPRRFSPPQAQWSQPHAVGHWKMFLRSKRSIMSLFLRGRRQKPPPSSWQ